MHQPEGVLFAIMTGLLDIIPPIRPTWLFTKETNNLTQNIDLKLFLVKKKERKKEKKSYA